MTRYKCYSCCTFFDSETGTCPDCGKEAKPACENDKPGCTHQMVDGVTRCPKCGEFVCPDCGAHDVMPISRITGYMSPIAEWNAGKREELKDRVRTDGL